MQRLCVRDFGPIQSCDIEIPRLTVMTGPQASGKSRTMSFEEATAMDTEYIMNWSLGLDWRILFKTATLKQ